MKNRSVFLFFSIFFKNLLNLRGFYSQIKFLSIFLAFFLRFFLIRNFDFFLLNFNNLYCSKNEQFNNDERMFEVYIKNLYFYTDLSTDFVDIKNTPVKQ